MFPEVLKLHANARNVDAHMQMPEKCKCPYANAQNLKMPICKCPKCKCPYANARKM
jgi:hypothetical protein